MQSKKGKIKIEDIDITLPGDRVSMVSTEKRGGKKYLVIELTDESSELIIDGISCS